MTISMVRIRLLGAFEVAIDVRSDGASVVSRFPTKRAGELVQVLALAPGHRLVRDQVIDALWPQLDASAGGANLRKAAHHARRALGCGEAVVLHHSHVELFPGATITTDVEEFLEAADAALASGAVDLARSAALLYSGELLPSARYESWAEDLRRVLAARHLELLRAIGQWDRVLELDPLDETAAREVMRSALVNGRRHRAIDVYGRLRSALSFELGVLPQPATDELYGHSLDGLVPPAPPFVGREQELAVLEALARQRRHQDRGALVLVRGPAGIGKSSFVGAVADRWRAADVVVALTIAEAPDDAFATLASIVEELLLRAPGAAARLTDRTRHVLARLTPVVRQGDDLTMPLTRHQLVGAVQRLVEAAGPHVALVVDDAHRADDSSLGVLAHLAEGNEGGAAVLLSYRLEAAGTGLQRVIARSERHTTTTIVDLGPLDRDALRSVAVSLGAPADQPSIDALAAASDGNAFLAVELCRAGDPGGDLQPSLVDMINRRFLDLDDDIVVWLRRLSLVDGAFDLTSVVALTSCTDDELVRLLDTAIAGGVLVAHQGQYRFRHDLLRRALADQLAPHRAVAVHRDAARQLAEIGARPGVVAHHWLAGSRPGRAVEWLLRAADDAVELGGYPAAVVYLDRILRHAPAHFDALRRRAAAFDAMGDPRAIAAYDDAARVATTEEVHELRPLQALAMVKLGDPEGGMRVVAGAEPVRLESKLAKALAYCGAGLMGYVDPEIGARLAAEGRRLALRAGDPSAIVVASWAQAGAAHAQGALRASLRADLEDTQSLPRLAVSVFDGQLCITQRLLYGSRPYDDVIRWTETFAREAERLGAARARAFAATLRGEAELLSGRLDDADRDLRRGRQLHHDMGAATGEAFSLQRLAEATAIRGDIRSAHRLLDESLAIARESDVGFHLFDRIYGTRILLASAPGAALAAVDESEEFVRGPLETCPGCRITLAVPAAIALAKAGDLDRLEAYEASVQWLAEVVMQLPAWYASLDEVRGHSCLAHGDRASARKHFLDAVGTFRAAGQPHDVVRIETELARLDS